MTDDSRAGRLRHWLTFEKIATESDGSPIVDSDGNRLESWADAFEVNARMPCEVRNLSGRELLAAQALQSRATHKIIARYRSGFNAAQRARNALTGAIFNLEAILPDDDSGRRFITFLASSGINAGGTAA